MRGGPAAAALLLVLLGSSGCDGDDDGSGRGGGEPAEPGAGTEPDPGAAGGHADPRAGDPHGGEGGGAPERRLAEVARLTGEAADGGAGTALEPEQPLEAGAELRTGARGVIVDFRQQGRIELGPRTRAALGGESPMQVFLGTGRVRAQLPPAGNSPRPPLRVAAPAVTVEIDGSGDAWVVALPDGGSWVAVLQGRASLSTGGMDDEERLRSWLLEAGQAVRVSPGEPPGEPGSGPGRVEAAAERTRRLREQTAQVPARKRAARIARHVEAVDAARERLDAELERGAEIEQAHKKAVAADKKGAGALQRDLVEHSRSRYRLRRALLAAWERLAARAAADDEGPAREAVEERRRAVLELLGRAGPTGEPKRRSP